MSYRKMETAILRELEVIRLETDKRFLEEEIQIALNDLTKNSLAYDSCLKIGAGSAKLQTIYQQFIAAHIAYYGIKDANIPRIEHIKKKISMLNITTF